MVGTLPETRTPKKKIIIQRCEKLIKWKTKSFLNLFNPPKKKITASKCESLWLLEMSTKQNRLFGNQKLVC